MKIELALLALCAAACGRAESSAPAASPPPATPPAAKTVGTPGSTNLAGMAQLLPMLREEAMHRPTVAITPEKLFGALTASGLALRDHKQVLAKAADAKYCSSAKLEHAAVIGIVVCEYESAAAAAAARDAMNAKLANTFDAHREVDGPTLVTVINTRSHPDVRERVLEVFRSL